jgi:glycogen operon protein
MPAPEDAFEPGQEPPLEAQDHMLVGPRSVVVLVGR